MPPPPISRRALLGAGLPLLAAAGLGGCATRGGSAAAEEGGPVLHLALPHDPENWDPHQPPFTVSRAVARQIAETLVDQDPRTGEIRPWLATEWEADADSRNFTFRLRDGVTFSDGQPLTARSVRANLDRIVELGPMAYVGASLLAGYEGTTVLDERTVRVSFSESNAQFLQGATTQTLSLLADATLQRTPDEVARGEVIGSGVYLLEDYRPGEKLVLRRRPDHPWGSGAVDHRGPAAFERVDLSFIPDPTTLVGALVSGQVDAAYPLDVATLGAIPEDRITLDSRTGSGISVPLVPLLHRTLMKEAAVRRALNHATDRQAIADRIFQGRVRPATSVLTRATPGWVDMTEYLRHDPARARQILEEAGWQEGPDGIRRRDGERLQIEIRYSGSGSTYEQMYQLLQHQWRQVGIDFRLAPTTPAQMSEYSIYDAPYDLSSWSQGRNDPDVLRVVYSSFYENQSFFFGRPVREIDDALLAMQRTVHTGKRAEAAARAQRLILRDGYSIPLFDSVGTIGWGREVATIPFDAELKPSFAGARPAGQEKP